MLRTAKQIDRILENANNRIESSFILLKKLEMGQRVNSVPRAASG